MDSIWTTVRLAGMSFCHVLPCDTQLTVCSYRVSDFVNSKEGHDVQKKFWGELTALLEERQPGITKDP